VLDVRQSAGPGANFALIVAGCCLGWADLSRVDFCWGKRLKKYKNNIPEALCQRY
jgi:hypothetical protein